MCNVCPVCHGVAKVKAPNPTQNKPELICSTCRGSGYIGIQEYKQTDNIETSRKNTENNIIESDDDILPDLAYYESG